MPSSPSAFVGEVREGDSLRVSDRVGVGTVKRLQLGIVGVGDQVPSFAVCVKAIRFEISRQARGRIRSPFEKENRESF